MKEKIEELLTNLLKKEVDFISKDGDVLVERVIDSAYRADRKLIEILLDTKETKEKFFSEIKGCWIFNINDFVMFLQDKHFLNDSYTQFKNKIGLNIGGKFLNERKEVSLVWPFKDCVLEGGMTKEDQDKKEIFFNEILAQDEIDKLFAPKVLTNWTRYTAKNIKGEEVKELKRDASGTIKENLIIKGNNLLALHTLKEQFKGKVKLIYIDPPYNTGSDSFGYNDNFNHSTWLTFMKNRLEISKKLLREDGSIFVQCDDNEQGYLKILLDEVFSNNYKSSIYVQVRYPDKQLATAMQFHKLIETIFVYGKTDKPLFFQDQTEYDISKYIFSVKEKAKPFKILDIGGKKVEVFKKNDFEIIKNKDSSENNLKEIWASGKILDSSSTGRFFRDFLDGRYSDDGYGVLYKVHGIGSGFGYRYITGPQKEGATRGKYYQEVPKNKLEDTFESSGVAISNFYNFADAFGNCRHEGGVELRSGKKPEILLKEIIEIATQSKDIVLDFHLGTGGTAAVAHKLGRQYIGIEQMDYGENDSVERLKNVIKGDATGISQQVNWKGGGEFIYCELMKYNENFVEEIKDSKDIKSLLKIWEQMKEKAFFKHNFEMQEFEKNIEEFKKLDLQKQKKLLFDILDKNQLYVNYSEVEDKKFKIEKNDKEMSKNFYIK
jgi:adenine-specific DNA-methyltransferase